MSRRELNGLADLAQASGYGTVTGRLTDSRGKVYEGIIGPETLLMAE